ncbi:MAG: ArsR family transcriptional regulator [Candidatus Saccharibacteria bacterium]|nr:ArsR family transcriptional regulator [Candidatus Saccharibacteria bacterium]MCY4010580.1 ArsR family transcriptional regulator [Candidatus Saccharibacteria bacterium]MCY4088916.1 ArsR family transcriptional regulator [Candidatus Saccharibacteria bacterium]
MLDTLITSRVRRKIIIVYAKYPDYRAHIRGLSVIIKEDVGNVYRELRRLEKDGFLLSAKKNNTKIYSTNRQCPFFKPLQSLVLQSQPFSRSIRSIRPSL